MIIINLYQYKFEINLKNQSSRHHNENTVDCANIFYIFSKNYIPNCRALSQ